MSARILYKKHQDADHDDRENDRDGKCWDKTSRVDNKAAENGGDDRGWCGQCLREADVNRAVHFAAEIHGHGHADRPNGDIRQTCENEDRIKP